MFVAGMKEDRQKYFGDRNWRPDRAQRQRLWKIRGRRRREIAEFDLQPF
jgi:hypothetical protein